MGGAFDAQREQQAPLMSMLLGAGGPSRTLSRPQRLLLAKRGGGGGGGD